MQTIISRPRMGGKTWDAVLWVKGDPDRVLLTTDERESQRVRREYGLPARKVMSAQGAIDGHRLYGRPNLQIGVDNIDYLGWRTLLRLGRWDDFINLATETRVV